MLGTTRHIGKYVLHEQLGRGGAAEVWRAFDPTLERDVAIKFLLPSRQAPSDAAQRFQREARAIASLCHPNIIQIYDISSDRYPVDSDDNQNDIVYLVMPYIQGPTLAKYIAQTSRIGKFPSPAEIVNLFTALGSAVDYAHIRGMIHRDIKPANILLDQRNAIDSIGFPILTDFGLVKLQDPSFDMWQSANAVLGTPLYVAPEQAQGFATTELSDLYSLGVILYELCAGKLPFDFPEQPADQHPLAALMQRVMFAPIPPSHVNPSISPQLEEAILKSIAKEPSERFPDARTMCEALVRAWTAPLPQIPVAEQHVQIPSPRPKLEEDVSAPSSTPKLEKQDIAALAVQRAVTSRRSFGKQQYKDKISAKRRRREKQQLGEDVYTPPVMPTSPPPRRFIPIILVSLFILGLVFLLSLGGIQMASHGRPSGNAVFGHVFFLGSKQGDPTQGQGVNDEVQVDFTQLAAPAPGKSYYGWLQGDTDRSDSPVIRLGRLDVVQGAAHLTYIDPQHRNLLTNMSRFLITEENTLPLPLFPSADRATWRDIGAISQIPNPKDQSHYSLLDHLRHLFATDPTLESLGLHGGLAAWFSRNIGQLQTLAQSAENSFATKDTVSLHKQLVRLLDYLDGVKDVARDIPNGPTMLVDATSAQVGLLQVRASQDPPSYLDHIAVHLLGLVDSPGVTADQKKIAASIVSELNSLRLLLEHVREIAQQMVVLSPDQILQSELSSQQIATLANLATEAYKGQGSEHGVLWIYQQMLSLAIIPVTAYHN